MVVLPGFGLFLRGQPQVMGVNLAVVCHPIAVAVAIAARLLGWTIARCLVVAAVVDQAIPLVATRNWTAPARFLRLWFMACRFRRRWPESLLVAGTALQRYVSLGEDGSRAVDADAHRHHPIRRPPALARLPHRIDGSTVAWRLDVNPTDDPADLDGRLRGLSLLDPRILSAELERRPNQADHLGDDRDDHHDDDRNDGVDDPSWSLVVDFDIEPSPLVLSIVDRRRVFVSIDPPSRQRHRHEEGDHHGNG